MVTFARRNRERHERFPKDVRQVLRSAGWRPGRNISRDVDEWLHKLRETQPGAMAGLPVVPAARAALAEFGRLRVPQADLASTGDGFTTSFHPPTEPFHRLDTDGARALGAMLRVPAFPVGVSDDGDTPLAVDADGRVFLLRTGGYEILGETIDEGIVALVRGAPGYLVDQPTGHW